MLAEVSALLAPLAAAIGYSTYKARQFEQAYPNIGELTDVGGYRMNAVHIERPENADLPALVFIHGASGNLLDQVVAFRAALEGRAEMLFVDRPGHGYSERGGPENAVPSGQADAIARLMEKRGIEKAIIVGHSFGGAITAAFGLRHPDKTSGLLFLAPATHPWPGGIDWYYHVATVPIVGWLFNHAIVVPLGLSRLERGTRNVFRPNPRPADYIEKTGPSLVLRPGAFQNNAADFKRLLAYVKEQSLLYSQITAPTVIKPATATRSSGNTCTRAALPAIYQAPNSSPSAASATSRIISRPMSPSPPWKKSPESRSTCRRLPAGPRRDLPPHHAIGRS